MRRVEHGAWWIYRRMDDDMPLRAMDGYLGHEYASNRRFMSYWRDDEACGGMVAASVASQMAKGHAEWYASYRTAICTVERHFCRSELLIHISSL